MSTVFFGPWTSRRESRLLKRGCAVDTRSDSSIVRLIRAGQHDRSAAGRLLEPYRGYLLLIARGFIGPTLRSKTAPSDAVQETMLRAYERFGQFRGTTEAELAAWLRRILTRHLVDVSRRYRQAGAREVRRERAQEALARSSLVFENFLAASGVSPSQGAAHRELGVILAQALDELSDDYREVLFLRHFEGLDWPEIGRRMGRSRKAAGMLWTRALEKVRPLIEKQL